LAAFITLFIAGALTTGLVYYMFKRLSSQASVSVGKERDLIRAEVTKYDDAIANALTVLESMVSFDEQGKIEVEKAKLAASIEVEQGKVTKLEKDLESLQVRVDKQEAKHSELKKGREDSDKLAKTLRENRERVQAEATAMNAQLGSTITNLAAIAGTMKLDADALATLKALEDSMKVTGKQLVEFSEIYTRGATRFVNLEKQYEDLDKEFRRLVDKALSGEEVEAEE